MVYNGKSSFKINRNAPGIDYFVDNEGRVQSILEYREASALSKGGPRSTNLDFTDKNLLGKLFNEQLIRLPANEIISAIKLTTELLNRKDFKNYSTIDLRINGKVITE